ncbi:MAG: ComF family protein [Candidatus Omnitrophota bacterium]|nr:ComF family protein [Candidatus Omnitrophota bacterium]
MLNPFRRSPLALVNLLYPPACLLCSARLPERPAADAPTGVVCEACAEAMPRSGRPICSCCGVGLPGAFDAILRCPRCRTRPFVFDLARAPWRYAGVAREAIHRFKYQRRWRLGRWLSEGMVTIARSSLPLDEVDAVLPVPLHWLKRRVKGENPAELLARCVACALKKAVLPHALRRTRWTTSQTRLSWPARSRNVRAAFAAGAAVANRTLLLVDDVLTSGATAQACAAALKTAGARRVFVLTAARTPLAR